MSIVLENLLSFAWRHWKAFLGIGMLISVLVYIGILRGEVSHWHKLANQLAEQNRLLEAAYATAANTARANNLKAVRNTEADGAQISKDHENALESQLADARALAASYARRMRGTPSNDQVNSGQAGLSEAARPAGNSDGTGGNALVPADDLRICADNTVIAKGWQTWYAAQKVRYDALSAAP